MSSLLEQSEVVKHAFDTDRVAAEKAAKPESVEQLRLAYLGKKGRVTALMEDLRNVAKEDRPTVGKAVNVVRQYIESQIEELKGKARTWELAAITSRPALDVTLPVGEHEHVGYAHCDPFQLWD